MRFSFLAAALVATASTIPAAVVHAQTAPPAPAVMPVLVTNPRADTADVKSIDAIIAAIAWKSR